MIDGHEENINNFTQEKAALDTILDVTQNPKRKKEFLECQKGKKAEFFKMGAMDVGYIGNKSDH